MKTFWTIFVCLPLFLFAQNPGPEFQKIETNVWTFTGKGANAGTSVIFLQDDGFLLFDTQLDDDDNQQLFNALRRSLGDLPLKTIIISQAHLEKFAGLRFAKLLYRDFEVWVPQGFSSQISGSIAIAWSAYQNNPNNSANKENILPKINFKEILAKQFFETRGDKMQILPLKANDGPGGLAIINTYNQTLYASDFFTGRLDLMFAYGLDLKSWHMEIARLKKEYCISRVISGKYGSVLTTYDFTKFGDDLEFILFTTKSWIQQNQSLEEFVANFESSFPDFPFVNKKNNIALLYGILRK